MMNTTDIMQTMWELTTVNGSDNGTSGDSFDWYVPISYNIAIGLLMAVVFVGVVGNLTVVVIVIRDPTMRTTPNAMVASLAFADMLVLLMSVPYKIIYHFTLTWPFGEMWCKVVYHMGVSCTLVSIYALVALSADRYHAIVRPTNYTSGRSKNKLPILVSSIWIIALLLGIPTALTTRKQTTQHEDINFCRRVLEDEQLKRLHTVMQCTLTFIFPLLLISIFYSMVAWRLLKSAWAIPGEANEKRPQLRSRKRLAIVVLTIVVLFTLCWFPHIFVTLLMTFHPPSMDQPAMFHAKVTADLLTYLNPCVNPYILCFMSSTYRKHFRDYFCRICDRKLRHQRQRRKQRRQLTCTTTGSSKGSTRTKLTDFLPM